MAYRFNPIEGIFDLVGGVEKEWTAFTPTIRSVSDTNDPRWANAHQKKALYKVVGKSLHIIWEYSHTLYTGATAGSGYYLFGIPAGYTIDTAKLNTATESNGYVKGTPVGHGGILQDFMTGGSAVVFAYNTIYLTIGANTYNTGYQMVDNGWYRLNVNNYRLYFTAEIPIL